CHASCSSVTLNPRATRSTAPETCRTCEGCLGNDHRPNHAGLGENHVVAFLPHAAETVRFEYSRQLPVRNRAKFRHAPRAEAKRLSECRRTWDLPACFGASNSRLLAGFGPKCPSFRPLPETGERLP